MADENLMKSAKKVLETICGMLDDRGWHYKVDEEKMVVILGARGEDLPMDILMIVRPEKSIVTIISNMPYSIPEERREQIGVAVNVVNFNLAMGSFDYDIRDGSLLFRINGYFRDSLMSKSVCEFMLNVVCGTVDEYNDRFLAISKCEMTTQEILDYFNSDN